jgi:hypothetical protein
VKRQGQVECLDWQDIDRIQPPVSDSKLGIADRLRAPVRVGVFALRTISFFFPIKGVRFPLIAI